MTAVDGGVLDPHGPVAEHMAELWWLMLVLGVAVFILFAALLVWGLIRRAPESSPEEARHHRLVRRWIGLGGVALPTVIIVVVFAATLVAMRATELTPGSDALEIEITGHQFWYEVHYPATGLVTANEVHVPTGRPLAFELRSTDVIHSFWVPALGGKLDMLPERVNTLVLRADEVGEHTSRCAEFCGLQHANMELHVTVESPGDFDAWMERQQDMGAAEGDLAERGRDVFVSADCVSCHAPRGQPTTGTDGPDLTTLPGRRMIGAGVVPNTSENVREWILDPQAVKPGVGMDPVDLTDEELEALLAYLGVDG